MSKLKDKLKKAAEQISGIKRTGKSNTIPNQNKPWYTYIIECSDSSLYTGITTNIQRRLHEHNHTKKGAKYTRTRRPVKLSYIKEFKTRSQACIEECRIKKLKRSQKLLLISKH